MCAGIDVPMGQGPELSTQPPCKSSDRWQHPSPAASILVSYDASMTFTLTIQGCHYQNLRQQSRHRNQGEEAFARVIYWQYIGHIPPLIARSCSRSQQMPLPGGHIGIVRRIHGNYPMVFIDPHGSTGFLLTSVPTDT
jgi:hypothetical protein